MLQPPCRPKVLLHPPSITLQGLAGVGLVHQEQLVLSLETTSALFFRQVSGQRSEDRGCIPSSCCVLGVPRPGSLLCPTVGMVLLFVIFKMSLVGGKKKKKEQLGKHLQRRGGVSSRLCSWLCHRKEKPLLEQGLKPFTLLSPAEHSLSFTVFHSLLGMLDVCKRSKGNGWKRQSIKSIKYKDTTQELPELKSPCCERIFRANIALCFSAPILFPKHLILAVVG